MEAGDIHNEQQLRRELARPALSFGFSAPLEDEFRITLWRDRRLPRAIFYLFPALLFGLAPLYGPALLETPDELRRLFRIAEFAFLVPICAAAALVDYLLPRRRISGAVHAFAVPSLWAAIILLRRESVGGGFYFPNEILGVAMIGAAVLCGFRFRRMLLGIVGFSLIAIASELTLEQPAPQAWMGVILQGLFAGLAIVGTWFNEGLYRRLWLQGRLTELASRTDPLTGLATRADFNRRFAQLFAQARRERCSVVVMLLDVDRFKQVNDRYGHLYGDEVLRAVGAAVVDTAARRPLDIAARYGGEEMVVVWYDMPADAIELAAGRVLDRIRAIRLPAAGEPPPVSASAGIVHLVPDGRRTPEETLHIADMLMYSAKREGRDRYTVQVFEP